ncbi:hypothetical protein [Holdemania massiliensis]
MDIIRYEIKKCLASSAFQKAVILILVIHCLTTAFLILQKEDGTSWISLAQARDEISLQTYQDQIDEAEKYPEFVEQILSEDDRLRHSTLFHDPNSYAFRNSQRKAAYYLKLAGQHFQFQPAFSLSFISQEPVSLTMVLLFFVFCAYFLFVKEREDHLEPILLPIPRFKNQSAWHKFASLLILGGGMFLFLEMLTGIISFLCLGGNLNLKLPIQTIIGFLYVPYAMSTSVFLFQFFVLKFLIVLFFMVLVSVAAIRFHQGPSFYLCLIILFSLEFWLFSGIKNESFLILLKYINLVALLQFNSYLTTFTSVPLGNYPIEVKTLILLICLMGMIIGGAFFGYSAFHRKTAKESNFNLKRNRQYRPQPLFYYEMKKFWMNGKNLFIVVLLAGVQVFQCLHYSPYIDKNEYYYQQFSFQLQGLLTDRQTLLITQQNQNYAEIQNQISELYTQYAADEIDRDTLEREAYILNLKLESMEGFRKAEQQVEQLKALEKTEYVYETPLTEIFKAKDEISIKAGMLFLAISFWVAAAVGKDNELQMDKLIRIYERKKHKVDRQKCRILFLVSGSLYSFLFLSTVIVKLNYYEAHLLTYSVSNVLTLGISLPISIFSFLLVIYGLGLFYVSVLNEVLLRLSIRQKNQNLSLWINIGVSFLFLFILRLFLVV